MKDAVKRLSKGDIKAHVDYEANNEFGELAGLLNLSFTELSRYIQAIDFGMSEFARGNFTLESPVEFQGDFVGIEKSISKFRDRMIDFLTEINMSAGQVRAGAEQVSGAAQNLAQGATEQASSVEELSSSLNEISLNISQNADYAGRADVLGNETGMALKDSGEQIRQLMAAINDISMASEGIDKIIKVINEIAFQTKILALNAAVEAARAGQAGKGFAVVADEVKNLAQKSAEAAQDTSVLIENSLAAVKRGNAIAGITSEVFEAVAKKSEEVLYLIKEIAAASREQAAAVAQISQGIDQVAAVVQANSATSQQSAASSEDLYSQSERLKMLLSQFIITKSK